MEPLPKPRRLTMLDATVTLAVASVISRGHTRCRQGRSRWRIPGGRDFALNPWKHRGDEKVRGHMTDSNSFKAFLIDLDGTLARAFLQVAPRVADAVKRVSKELTVGIVSSRDYKVVGELADSLGLASLQISEGGARFFDPKTQETAWLHSLTSEDARRIIAFLEEHDLPFSAVDADRKVESAGEVSDWRITRITATSLTPSRAQDIADRFGAMPGIHTSKIVRIDNGDWMVDFTHAAATKATAVVRYAALNGIEPSQIIAAGDSFNDLPLLQACGLRIAMGNAVPELKAIADYVAPSVDEDGLATAIDEFVLPTLRPTLRDREH